MRKIPLSLTWIMPLAAIPVLIYALRVFLAVVAHATFESGGGLR